jgi:hypothetical protein
MDQISMRCRLTTLSKLLAHPDPSIQCQCLAVLHGVQQSRSYYSRWHPKMKEIKQVEPDCKALYSVRRIQIQIAPPLSLSLSLSLSLAPNINYDQNIHAAQLEIRLNN